MAGGPATCLAARSALRFLPTGVVHACCVNSRFTVGDVRVQTIREIWAGERNAALAAALAVGDFSLGCQECGDHIGRGHRDESYAPTFDRHADTLAPDWPRRLEFAITNTCNLMCVQCSGELSSAIRSRREHREALVNPYGEAFFAELPAFLAHAEVAVFLGGEPFLSRSCARVWDLLREQATLPEVHVTTNATIWNDRVERDIRDLRMSLGVSIDAVTPAVLESIRVGIDAATAMDNLRRFRRLATEVERGFGINACLMVGNWQELEGLLLLGDELDSEVVVIVVTEPPAHSLLHLPREQLGPIVDELHRHDDRVRRRLGRNVGAWATTLAQLTDHLEAGGREVPVAAPGPSEGAIRARLREAHESLWGTGAEPVELAADDGVVTTVGDRPWAAAWGLPGWVGTEVAALPDRIGAVLGGQPRIEITPVGTALLKAEVIGGSTRVEVVVGEWVDGGQRHLRVLIGPPQPHPGDG